MTTLELVPCQENVLGFPVSALPFEAQIDLIFDWAREHSSRFVCVSNVHMLMEARWNEPFSKVLLNADLITPDGMPLVWMLNLIRGYCHDRVAGMDIFLAVCQRASAEKVPIFFLGTDASTLDLMRQRLQREFPNLEIADMQPLPFRPLTEQEDREIIQQINDSGAGILFLALGCPKQETWMHQHKGKVQAVMIGLGGVFPIYAGVLQLAPDWVRESGLEWLFRLTQEPTRLWKRYASTIPPFVFLSLKQLMTVKVSRVLEYLKPHS
ncbi:WecB/TagA/CpsF family glycosyltransferase [Pseudanabaena sp. FACHB-2040]|uniref:WecB/TagA/CpsF family glycosyltransferase n=1 Tax=Pseudanabaena sp. FACHB-2040 TaxID=2692859 RepID=UPI0016834138|nr:WecB/TagA/CpsF family glycosyltransferase [Pseudanabaena sp. FACHB-2040]MBD2260604.1 WecB/TagA/CpsF family glycosyltransferase [Pseudanabaena sp. FACHB-2040]